MAKETINLELVKAAGRIQLVKKVGEKSWRRLALLLQQERGEPELHIGPGSEQCSMYGHETCRTIMTAHSYGHPMLFKPSKYEVLKCIPEGLLDVVTGFEILDGVETDYNNSNHIAKVNLYTTSNSYINNDIEL